MTNQIIIPIYYYKDEDGVIHYDIEEMQEYFENEISKLPKS